MRVKMSKHSTRTYSKCPTIIQIVGRPGTGSLPRTIAPPDHLQNILESGGGGGGVCAGRGGDNLVAVDKLSPLVLLWFIRPLGLGLRGRFLAH